MRVPALLRILSTFVAFNSFFVRGGDSEAIELIIPNVLSPVAGYNANVVQANEIMQIYLQLFYNERRLHSTKLNYASE